MNIVASERKQGTGTGTTRIGIFKGPLKYLNPNTATLKELYNIEGDMEEVKYSGKDKNEKNWSLLKFIFEEEMHKIPVVYDIFLSKEIAEFEKDGVMKTWYINQWGQSQLVADKKDLFKSFTHIQKQNEEKVWVDVLDENDKPVELSWRKAFRGEVALYGLLRKLVTQNWWEANQDTNIFINIDSLIAGKLSEIRSFIDTENFQPVVGMVQAISKDGYINNNCVDGAWMPGWKMPEANLTTQSNSWGRYDDKANGKGKNKEMYEFYQSVKRCKNTISFKYLHELNPDEHLATSSDVIRHSDNDTVEDTDY